MQGIEINKHKYMIIMQLTVQRLFGIPHKR